MLLISVDVIERNEGREELEWRDGEMEDGEDKRRVAKRVATR